MPQLYCNSRNCPIELLHPPEDCNVNSSLSFTLQVPIFCYEIIEAFTFPFACSCKTTAFPLFIHYPVVSAVIGFLHICLFVIQICRVEDILVQGLVEGSVMLFHRARTITVLPSGIISTTGMGMIFIFYIK